MAIDYTDMRNLQTPEFLVDPLLGGLCGDGATRRIRIAGLASDRDLDEPVHIFILYIYTMCEGLRVCLFLIGHQFCQTLLPSHRELLL